jgi:hypothetical protein
MNTLERLAPTLSKGQHDGSNWKSTENYADRSSSPSPVPTPTTPLYLFRPPKPLPSWYARPAPPRPTPLGFAGLLCHETMRPAGIAARCAQGRAAVCSTDERRSSFRAGGLGGGGLCSRWRRRRAADAAGCPPLRALAGRRVAGCTLGPGRADSPEQRWARGTPAGRGRRCHTRAGGNEAPGRGRCCCGLCADHPRARDQGGSPTWFSALRRLKPRSAVPSGSLPSGASTWRS